MKDKIGQLRNKKKFIIKTQFHYKFTFSERVPVKILLKEIFSGLKVSLLISHYPIQVKNREHLNEQHPFAGRFGYTVGKWVFYYIKKTVYNFYCTPFDYLIRFDLIWFPYFSVRLLNQ